MQLRIYYHFPYKALYAIKGVLEIGRCQNVANRIGPYYKEDKDEYKRIIDELINNKEIEIKQL